MTIEGNRIEAFYLLKAILSLKKFVQLVACWGFLFPIFSLSAYWGFLSLNSHLGIG